STELGEFLRVLQELDDLLELDLCFVGASDIIERHFRSVTRQQLRLRLAEAESLGTPGLHRTEQEEPDSEDEQVREEADQDRGERRARLLGLDLHSMIGEALHFVRRILHRQHHLELLDEPSADGNFLLESTADCLPALNGDLLDVALLELVLVLGRVGNLGRGVRSLPRELDDRDGHEYDKNPERELLGNLAPVRRLFGCFIRHLYRHLLQARYVRQMAEILRVIKPITYQKLIRRIKTNELRLELQP